MTVSQGQVAGQGHTVAQAKVSVHMVGVTAKVEAMVAEQGGVETAEVQNVLGRAEEDMVVECFVIYIIGGSRDGCLGCGGDLQVGARWRVWVRGWAPGCRGLL